MQLLQAVEEIARGKEKVSTGKQFSRFTKKTGPGLRDLPHSYAGGCPALSAAAGSAPAAAQGEAAGTPKDCMRR